MSQYLLSTYAVEGRARAPMEPEEMQTFMERVHALEAEMKASGTFVFTGRLHDPDAATVVRSNEGDLPADACRVKNTAVTQASL